jgi:hypothetical protein
MRRVWAFIVAFVLFGIMGWNLVTGQPILDDKVTAAGITVLAFTITWWFETADRPRH